MVVYIDSREIWVKYLTAKGEIRLKADNIILSHDPRAGDENNSSDIIGGSLDMEARGDLTLGNFKIQSIGDINLKSSSMELIASRLSSNRGDVYMTLNGSPLNIDMNTHIEAAGDISLSAPSYMVSGKFSKNPMYLIGTEKVEVIGYLQMPSIVN